MSRKAEAGGGDIVAIIPARAGSKRLPGKNMLELGGRPLVQWSMDRARESGVFREIYVSSDDPAVLELATELDCAAVERPAHLATDQASLVEVVRHVLDRARHQGRLPDAFMLLQPTSPLRAVEDIQRAVELWHETQAPAIISVSEARHSPLWCATLSEDGDMKDFIATINGRRSQELPRYYCLNGAIYLLDSRVFLAGQGFLPAGARAYPMPQERSVDIDTPLDMAFAAFLVSRQ